MSINEILFKKCWVQSIEETGLQLKLRKRLLGVQPLMQRFNYYFRVLISQKILEHSDKSSESIQCADLTAIDVKNVVNCTIKTLDKMRCDDDFQLLWITTKEEAERPGITKLTLPRR